MSGEKPGSPGKVRVANDSPFSNEPRPIKPVSGGHSLWNGMYSPNGTRWTLS